MSINSPTYAGDSSRPQSLPRLWDAIPEAWHQNFNVSSTRPGNDQAVGVDAIWKPTTDLLPDATATSFPTNLNDVGKEAQFDSATVVRGQSPHGVAGSALPLACMNAGSSKHANRLSNASMRSHGGDAWSRYCEVLMEVRGPKS